MRDRRLIAIVASGIVVVALILVIVFVAVEPIPDFAALEGSGETGYVAWSDDSNGGDRSPRVLIANLGTGAVVEADVRGDGAEGIGWDEDGYLVVIPFGPGPSNEVLVDPDTGEVVGDVEWEPDQQEPPWPIPEPVWIEHDDGHVALERDDTGGIVRFEAPDSYDINSAAAMGASRIVFVDELGRVAVSEPGDPATPILVAEDAVEWWVLGRDA